MYRHGWKLGRLYLSVDVGDCWRGWLCALFRVGLEPWAVGRAVHLKLTVGPLMLDLKVL
jgi:hypothetical protein